MKNVSGFFRRAAVAAVSGFQVANAESAKKDATKTSPLRLEEKFGVSKPNPGQLPKLLETKLNLDVANLLAMESKKTGNEEFLPFKSEKELKNNVHPLATFDNQIIGNFNYLGQETLSVRIITSAQSAIENSANTKILLPIAYETQQRLIKELQKKGKEVPASWFEKEFKKPSDADLDKWSQEELPEKFGKDDNYTLMLVENQAGKAVSAMAFTINDEKEKRNLRIQDESPVIFFDLSQTLPEYSGNGLLKTMRSFFLPDLLIKSGFSGPAHICNSTKRQAATNPNNGEIICEEIPNFKVHGKIFNFLGPTRILERWRDHGQTNDHSRVEDLGHPLESFLTDNQFDDQKILAWIKQAKKQQPDKKLEGCFMISEVESLEMLRDKAHNLLAHSKDRSLMIQRKSPNSLIHNTEHLPLSQESQKNQR